MYSQEIISVTVVNPVAHFSVGQELAKAADTLQIAYFISWPNLTAESPDCVALAARMCALLERRASCLKILARLLNEPQDRVSEAAQWLAEKGHLRLLGNQREGAPPPIADTHHDEVDSSVPLHSFIAKLLKKIGNPGRKTP
ncbi:MAG: hypothetical protein ACRCTU_04420 [Zoogloea sp.]|uniref:hypothetical protein n=1 Tax=Zoogloea sp. TaxID=49181 RepID=UPI003F411DE7